MIRSSSVFYVCMHAPIFHITPSIYRTLLRWQSASQPARWAYHVWQNQASMLTITSNSSLVLTEKQRKRETYHVRRGPKSFLGFSKRQRFLYSHLTPHATPTEMHVKSSCLFSPISSFFHFILWYSNFSHRRFMCTHTNTHLNAYTCAVKVNSQMIMWSWQCSMPRIARRDTLARTQQFSWGFDQRIMKWEKRMIIEKKVRTHAHERRDGITSINKSVTTQMLWHRIFLIHEKGDEWFDI